MAELRLGYIDIRLPAATPMLLMLNVHYTRVRTWSSRTPRHQPGDPDPRLPRWVWAIGAAAFVAAGPDRPG